MIEEICLYPQGPYPLPISIVLYALLLYGGGVPF